MIGGVEVHQAKSRFHRRREGLPGRLVRGQLAQPYKPYAWALLERQKYPDLRQYPGGPPIPPYDNAGWTLPLQMGVDCDQVDEPFEAELDSSRRLPQPSPLRPPPSRRRTSSSTPGQRLLQRGLRAAQGKGRDLAAPRKRSRDAGFEAARRKLHGQEQPGRPKDPGRHIRKKWPVHLRGLADISAVPKAPLRKPRDRSLPVLAGQHGRGLDRYVFDDLGIPYTTMHNDAFKPAKDKKRKVDLRAEL